MRQIILRLLGHVGEKRRYSLESPFGKATHVGDPKKAKDKAVEAWRSLRDLGRGYEDTTLMISDLLIERLARNAKTRK